MGKKILPMNNNIMIKRGIFLKKYAVFLVILLSASCVHASEVFLKNGDKISGKIAADNGTAILLDTEEAGEIKIDKTFIDLPKTFPQTYGAKAVIAAVPIKPPVVWKKDLSLGYTQNGGNTKAQLGQFSGSLNRKTTWNETTFKVEGTYSASNGAMNGKKFYGLARYAYSFGKDRKWYNFYKFEGTQDYFADIYYRLNPTTGIGYWFSNNDNLKANAELGVGYQYTVYRVESTDAGDGADLVPRFFIDKRLIRNLHLSEDFTFYPSLANVQDYRLRSETDLINRLNERWSFKISYIDDFNSYPQPGFKKNDYTFVTSLEYHF